MRAADRLLVSVRGLAFRFVARFPLVGVVSGLRGRAGGTFEGVALYAEWTTDPEDWAVYERVWRGHTVP